MKNLILIVSLLTVSFINAQAFSGNGDNKFQVGINFQEYATGINLSYDLGLGDNISVGLSSTYALSISNGLKNNPDEASNANFEHRVDLRARFNAHLGNIINVDENFDLYPGLSLGLKNFGSHVGARYFFSDGFGVFTELNVPIAPYDNTNDPNPRLDLNNQFTINLGAVFSI